METGEEPLQTLRDHIGEATCDQHSVCVCVCVCVCVLSTDRSEVEPAALTEAQGPSELCRKLLQLHLLLNRLQRAQHLHLQTRYSQSPSASCSKHHGVCNLVYR